MEKGQIVMQVETAKVTHVVEAQDSGFLHILVLPGETHPVGTAVGQLAETKEELAELQARTPAPQVTAAAPAEAAPAASTTASVPAGGKPGKAKISLLDGRVVLWEDIHIGVAVALQVSEFESGLIVPVVKNADRKSLAEISHAVATTVAKVREGKIMPDDVTGSTFTLTNTGTFGNMWAHGTPIIHQPESAILQTGSIVERPAVVEGEVVARPMMPASLTFDHRILDGAPVSLFLAELRDRIENPAMLILSAQGIQNRENFTERGHDETTLHRGTRNRRRPARRGCDRSSVQGGQGCHFQKLSLRTPGGRRPRKPGSDGGGGPPGITQAGRSRSREGQGHASFRESECPRRVRGHDGSGALRSTNRTGVRSDYGGKRGCHRFCEQGKWVKPAHEESMRAARVGCEEVSGH